MAPLISVIIPVYNTKQYLKNCLDSVLRQTYTNLEIIIIDDGSNDGSAKICDAYAKKDQRIQLIHQKNAGLSAARNAGLKIAKGEYLTFIDGDDSVTVDYVERLLKLVKKYQTNLSICSFAEIYPKRTFNFGQNYAEKCFNTTECLRYMLNEQGFTTTAWGKLYARTLWENLKFPEGKLHEDIGVVYQTIIKCDKIAYTPEPNYYYYQRKSSITNQKFTADKFAIIELTDKMCDELDRKFPELKNVTNCRRMHARFSILRQMPSGHKLSPALKTAQKQIIKYLRQHKDYILKNPESTPRDHIAMRMLLIGSRAFKGAWKAYSRVRK
ncbi:glycosyltransferase [Candidatus Saccharibacteria bacterium]|nr:glycosyltransferase [Candidatus Saccharibacteria bacterium]